jgi:GNAT superfamily N-acetyltransferase
MRIDSLEPAVVDVGLAGALAALRNATAAVDAAHLAPVSAEYARLRLLHSDENLPLPHLFVAVDEGGEVVGSAELRVFARENRHAASIELLVRPDFRAGDVGDRLYVAARHKACSLEKSLLLADAWADSPGEQFWRRQGFSVASRDAQRRLSMAAVDWPRLEALHAQSVAASRGYEVVRLPTPVPPESVESILELQRAMNDSPLDDLEVEASVWSEDRLRAFEHAYAGRGIRLHRLVARRLADGEYGGHTLVAVEDERPHLGFQEDTAVIRSHRGHRLGLRLKIEMLRLLAALEPQIVQIDTWNAESNTHMVAVNEALGCVVVGRAVELQKRLRAGQAQSWPSSRSSASSTVPS